MHTENKEIVAKLVASEALQVSLGSDQRRLMIGSKTCACLAQQLFA